jgi:hypothetical protein
MNRLTVDQMLTSVTFAQLDNAYAAGYINADKLTFDHRGKTVASYPKTHCENPDGTPAAYELYAIAGRLLPAFRAYNAMPVKTEDLGLDDGVFAISTPVWFTHDPTCRFKLMYAPGTIERVKSRIDAIDAAI